MNEVIDNLLKKHSPIIIDGQRGLFTVYQTSTYKPEAILSESPVGNLTIDELEGHLEENAWVIMRHLSGVSRTYKGPETPTGPVTTEIAFSEEILKGRRLSQESTLAAALVAAARA